ncbi:MAG: rhomboid family intramembrane serine protease [Lachnospiraceae bacterium]|nr:rhomboid family intramembrane serine protease [Lachnospiraceae bacterium]
MLTKIIALLEHRGYHCLREDWKGILVREAETVSYVITVTWLQSRMPVEEYERMRRQAEWIAASIYHKPVQTLHLVVSEEGAFDRQTRTLVEQVEQMWLIAMAERRVYIFENQPQQFDDLYTALEQAMTEEQAGGKLPFTITPVNIGIVSLNILYFIVIIVVNNGYSAVYNIDTMLNMGASSYDTIMSGQWYRMITSLFVHFGLSHLMNNMVLLTYVGCELERRIGSLAYGILYLSAGLGGNLLSLWCYRQEEDLVSAGASGAIFGVIGALFMVLIMQRSETKELTPERLLIMSCITIYYGFTTTGVDNAAHIGGLICGIIGGFLLSKVFRYGKLE